jgi:hypothetical protein
MESDDMGLHITDRRQKTISKTKTKNNDNMQYILRLIKQYSIRNTRRQV